MKLQAFIVSVLLVLVNWAYSMEIQEPVYSNGNSWVYKQTTEPSNKDDGVYKIEFADGEFFGDNMLLSGHPHWVTVYRKDLWNKNANENWQIGFKEGLRFPLHEGKQWQFDFMYRSKSSKRNGWSTAIAKVTAIGKKIETAALTCETVEISRTDVNALAKHELVYWYCPQTKSVIKFVDTIISGRTEVVTRELIEFK